MRRIRALVFMAPGDPDVIFGRPFFLHIYFKGQIFSGCSQDKMYHLPGLSLLNYNFIFYLVYLKFEGGKLGGLEAIW